MNTYTLYSSYRDRWEYADLKVVDNIAWHSTVTFTTLNDYTVDEILILNKNGTPWDVVIVSDIQLNNFTKTIIARSPLHDIQDSTVQSVLAIQQLGRQQMNDMSKTSQLSINYITDMLVGLPSRVRSQAWGYDIDVSAYRAHNNAWTYGSFQSGLGENTDSSNALNALPIYKGDGTANSGVGTVRTTSGYSASDLYNGFLDNGFYPTRSGVIMTTSPNVISSTGTPTNMPRIKYDIGYQNAGVYTLGGQIAKEPTMMNTPNIINTYVVPDSGQANAVFIYAGQRPLSVNNYFLAGGLGIILNLIDPNGAVELSNVQISAIPLGQNTSIDHQQSTARYQSSTQISNSYKLNENLIPYSSKMLVIEMSDADLADIITHAGLANTEVWDVDVNGNIPWAMSLADKYLPALRPTTKGSTIFMTDDVSNSYVGNTIMWNGHSYLITEQCDNLIASTTLGESVLT